MISDDGAEWYIKEAASMNLPYYSVCWAKEAEIFMAVGEDTAMYSDNG
jgi:hypothetical protein